MSQPTGPSRTLGPNYSLHPLFSLHQAHRLAVTWRPPSMVMSEDVPGGPFTDREPSPPGRQH